jgi:lipid-A-disaccharide synthase
MGKEIVTELIQGELNVKNLRKELALILEGSQREAQLAAYDTLEKKLGGGGASKKAAMLIVKNS